ncbi:MAG: hypothetical protein GY936_10255 [Ignavibacteriae bacterium]|nr:hypothetical protein [Ignavibacteriota bacterium]
MKRSFIYIAVLLFSSTIWAQFNVGVSGLVLTPQKEFKRNIKNNGYGLSITGVYHCEETPFSLGLNVGWARYGSESRSETLLWPVKVDVTTNNDIAFMHLIGRAENNFGIFKPYAEFLYGFNYLFTNTEIEDAEDDGISDIASDTQFDDFALSYGVTAGTMIKVFEFENKNNTKTPPTMFLDFKVRYMLGGEADYLKKGDLTRGSNDEILYNKSRSDIDFISYQIGLVFQL